MYKTLNTVLRLSFVLNCYYLGDVLEDSKCFNLEWFLMCCCFLFPYACRNKFSFS